MHILDPGKFSGNITENPIGQNSFFRSVIYIGGHRNPDLDSIAAAMGYEALKEKQGQAATAVRLGEINTETALFLSRYNLPAPPQVLDIRTQVRDLTIDHPEPVAPENSLWEIWENHLRKKETPSLPVADGQGYFFGIVTSGDIASFDMEQLQTSTVSVNLSNLLRVLAGKILLGGGKEQIEGSIHIAGHAGKGPVGDNGKGEGLIDRTSIVLDNHPSLDNAWEAARNKAACYIACNTLENDPFTDGISRQFFSPTGPIILSTPYDLHKALRLVPLASSVSSILQNDGLITFSPTDYLDDVKEGMLSSRHRAYPVIDSQNHYAGMISRYHLMRPARKKVILVDHNEVAQSFPGIEQAEVVEIIDHHRIGDITTDGPIYVRNEPVGSTSTIIAMMYEEQDTLIDPPIAGMLLGAILSDTIYFKSPTTTPADEKTAKKLEAISGENIADLAELLFAPNEKISSLSVKELLHTDFKVFNLSGSRVGISQISVLDISQLMSRKEELLAQMDRERTTEDYDMLMMALTDINLGGSQILISGSLGKAVERAYGEQTKDKNCFFLPGVLSRKKQIVPQLSMVVGYG